MANVAVRGQPVNDPWLTWSVPEYGEGFWPVNDQGVNSLALAQQAVPDAVGPRTVPHPASDPAIQIDPAVQVLIAEEAARSKPSHYGATTEWLGTETTFTGTLRGWGLLVRDPTTSKHVPTVRAGRVLFGTGLVVGLIWGVVGRSW